MISSLGIRPNWMTASFNVPQSESHLFFVRSAQVYHLRIRIFGSMSEVGTKQIIKLGIMQLALSYLMLSIQIVVFSLFAGFMPGIQQWIYFGTAFIHSTVSTAFQLKLNPELFAQRLKFKREGSKLWDEVLMRVSNLMVLIVIPAAAGVEIGRHPQSNLNIGFAVVGLSLASISTILLNWAMIVNPHFEPTVRIQKDRDHKVIRSGPYGIVRHPGYLAAILYSLSMPLLMGSALAFIPAGIHALLMVIRTWLEDKTLQEELKGYTEYANQTRCRLFPGIW